MDWDVFCRVVDNYGDIGVCWRLSADLAARGDRVRLWTDDAGPLAWMAPHGAPGVEIRAWPADDDASTAPGAAVIEAFGCRLPTGFVQRMSVREPPPVWINLEYLSAEDYVDRNHGLRSPQLSGPGQGLDKWFFYPGFTERSGGLLHEPDLEKRLAAFNAAQWLQAQGIERAASERCVSVFCYANPALPALLDALSAAPTLLLVTPGLAARQVRDQLGSAGRRGPLRAHYLPALPQTAYDHLLWSCDLNLVRGEDSFVRAQWAGKPFLWQIYPQDDRAHEAKLAAFNRRFLADTAADLAAAVERAAMEWNGFGGRNPPPAGRAGFALPAPALWPPWRSHCEAWRARLLARPDLATALRAFVLERR